MEPPRIPLHTTNRLNLQLPIPSPFDGLKGRSATARSALAKASEQSQVKRYVAPEVMEEFKAAVQGSELTKLGLVEVLKKQ